MNYKVLAISGVLSGAILGYFFIQSQKLEEAAEAHQPAASESVAPER